MQIFNVSNYFFLTAMRTLPELVYLPIGQKNKQIDLVSRLVMPLLGRRTFCLWLMDFFQRIILQMWCPFQLNPRSRYIKGSLPKNPTATSGTHQIFAESVSHFLSKSTVLDEICG